MRPYIFERQSLLCARPARPCLQIQLTVKGCMASTNEKEELGLEGDKMNQISAKHTHHTGCLFLLKPMQHGFSMASERWTHRGTGLMYLPCRWSHFQPDGHGNFAYAACSIGFLDVHISGHSQVQLGWPSLRHLGRIPDSLRSPGSPQSLLDAEHFSMDGHW